MNPQQAAPAVIGGRDIARRWVVVLSVAAVVLVSDQATKYVAVRDLTGLFERAQASGLTERVRLFFGEDHIHHLSEGPQVVVPGLLRLRYTENPGAAFALLQRTAPGFKRLFFLVVTLLAAAFVGVMVHRRTPLPRSLVVALGGVLGGAVGNFVDRLAHGYVIDFIDLRMESRPGLHWPTFNLADVGITVGVLLLLVYVLVEAFRRDA